MSAVDFMALVHEQLKHVEAPEVRRAYLEFASAGDSLNLEKRATGHGYIQREIRFERSGNWYFAAVLNKGWVLWYFRWPAFRDGLLDHEKTLQEFPEAEVTRENAIKIRVRSVEIATSIVLWLEGANS